jgi:hypothetical protein
MLNKVKYRLAVKKIIALLFYIAFYTNVNAQYYYKDILSTKQITADLNAYKVLKIEAMKAKDFSAKKRLVKIINLLLYLQDLIFLTPQNLQLLTMMQVRY